MRALRRALCVGDEFPSTLGQKPVIGTDRELSSILEGDTVRRFHDTPVREHQRVYVTAPSIAARRTINHITLADLRQLLGAPICHEHPRVTRGAVHAPALTSAVRIDRLLEGNIG